MNIEDLLKMKTVEASIRWVWSNDPDHENEIAVTYLPQPGVEAMNTFLGKECVVIAIDPETMDCMIIAPWAKQCYEVDFEFYFSWSYPRDLELK